MLKKCRLSLFFILLLITGRFCYAEIITINGKVIIDKPTRYKNVTLDLSRGYFSIVSNGSLEIESSLINGIISPENKQLLQISSGNLILRNNKFNISVRNIPPNPSDSIGYYMINLLQGGVNITNNEFKIDKPYTVGFFVTNQLPNSHLTFDNNKIAYFHGGILLRNTTDSTIVNNQFTNVGLSNILNLECNNNVLIKNSIYFPGNNNVGDGIDIISSDNILISENIIASGSCYSIVISNSNSINIDRNRVMGGITYAIYVEPFLSKNVLNKHLLNLSVKKKIINKNKNISITNNYFAQNRYGLATINVDGLIVKNNIFVQRFSNNNNRQFWTNNDILLQNTENIIWENNLYKEAFTQESPGCNVNSTKFVIFPLHGGVTL